MSGAILRVPWSNLKASIREQLLVTCLPKGYLLPYTLVCPAPRKQEVAVLYSHKNKQDNLEPFFVNADYHVGALDKLITS